jgi:hypothetical protein
VTLILQLIEPLGLARFLEEVAILVAVEEVPMLDLVSLPLCGTKIE